MKTQRLFFVAILVATLAAAVSHFLPQRVQATGANTLHGTILDSSNNPIGGIEVGLFKRNGGEWIYTDVRQFSDALTGSFAFTGLADGDYTLAFSHPNGEWLQQYYKNQRVLADADPIILNGNDPVEVSATLQRGASIAGTVTSDAQPPAPLGNVQVDLWQQADNGWSKLNTFYTGDNGIYRIHGLAAGVYRLHFGDPNSTLYFDVFYPAASTLETAESVILAAGEERGGIDVQLQRKSVIVGSVTLPAQAPVSGIRICAVAPGTGTDALTGAPVACAGDDLSEGDGTYAIPSLRGGEYLLYLKDNAFPQRVFDRWYPAAPGAMAGQSLHLDAGATLIVDPITLAAADSVYGAVRTAQNSPASSVQVRLYEVTTGGLRWEHTAYTDVAGRFDLQLRHPAPTRWVTLILPASTRHFTIPTSTHFSQPM